MTAIYQCLLLSCTELLTLSLKEFHQDSAVAIEVKVYRNITLVPGRSYEINCHSNQGFSISEHSSVWLTSDDQPVEIQTNQGSDESITTVYSYRLTNNDWKLVVTHFAESISGYYTCKGIVSKLSLGITSGI